MTLQWFKLSLVFALLLLGCMALPQMTAQADDSLLLAQDDGEGYEGGDDDGEADPDDDEDEGPPPGCAELGTCMEPLPLHEE